MEALSERVYSVLDYHDGPIRGLADYGGRPQLYQAIFSVVDDEWVASTYELSPVSDELFALAMESWSIWLRFDAALRSGAVLRPADISDWGALTDELPRRRALQTLLDEHLTIDAAERVLIRGEFRAVQAAQPIPLDSLTISQQPLEVCWQRLE